jgi:hypothetical protein
MHWTPLTAILILLILLPAQAQAYLDPGTGSAVIQMLVAGVMGALFVIKTYWRKLAALFGGASDEEVPSAAVQSATTESAAEDERE